MQYAIVPLLLGPSAGSPDAVKNPMQTQVQQATKSHDKEQWPPLSVPQNESRDDIYTVCAAKEYPSTRSTALHMLTHQLLLEMDPFCCLTAVGAARLSPRMHTLLSAESGLRILIKA